MAGTRRSSVLPGFRLTLGFTLFYLCLIVLVPLMTLPARTATLGWSAIWQTISDPRVVAGLVPLEVCVGADFFFRETFNGNGRTCASCHRVERNFTIDPAFIATLPANDPLFVAEFNSTLANLERPAQMRARSLILENVDGTQPGGANVRFVLRSTPHNLSMGVSILTPPGTPNPPAERTGWRDGSSVR